MIGMKDRTPRRLLWATENPDEAVAHIAELEAALGEARLQIEYLHHEKWQPTGSGNAVLARINAVLAGKA